jgi:hypothetical protein
MMYPGLASWAKFSRPCGTKFVNPGFTHDLSTEVLLGFGSIHPLRNVETSCSRRSESICFAISDFPFTLSRLPAGCSDSFQLVYDRGETLYIGGQVFFTCGTMRAV